DNRPQAPRSDRRPGAARSATRLYALAPQFARELPRPRDARCRPAAMLGPRWALRLRRPRLVARRTGRSLAAVVPRAASTDRAGTCTQPVHDPVGRAARA